jgi:catechol 2,3-dioxygenase-like lactoylglutathione lyase family enzyme
MNREDFPAPEKGFVVTCFLTVKDIPASVAFYTGVLGGQLVMEGEPSIVKLANTWITVNKGGGPTEDKPQYSLAAPTADQRTFNSFLNLRVADIEKCFQEWRDRGADFLTGPTDRGAEIRCYMKDPDGYIIEVGQIKAIPAPPQ